MRYTRKHELMLYVAGLAGFLGLLLAGTYYRPGETWLRDAALVWFLGFGLVRCLALLTIGRGPAEEAGPSAISSSEPGRPWG